MDISEGSAPLASGAAKSILIASMVAIVGVFTSACGGAVRTRETPPPTVVSPLVQGAETEGRSCRCRWVHLPVRVAFDPRSSTVDPAEEGLLAELAQWIEARPSVVTLRVEGHSAMCPEEVHDQALSEARASAVRDRLVAHGVPSAMLSTIGYATTQPRKASLPRSPRSKERAERCGQGDPTGRESTVERRVEFSIRDCTRETPDGTEACPDQPEAPGL